MSTPLPVKPAGYMKARPERGTLIHLVPKSGDEALCGFVARLWIVGGMARFGPRCSRCQARGQKLLDAVRPPIR